MNQHPGDDPRGSERRLVHSDHGDLDPATPPELRIVVIDDHELLRAGTRQLLDEATGFAVVGEAGDSQSALRIVRDRRPDLVLLDIRLQDGSGIDVARQVLTHDPAPMVVILSAYDDEHYVRAALAVGVSGYFLKTLPADELVAQIRQLVRHPSPVPQLPALDWVPPGQRRDRPELTLREREVVRLAARGMANKQIARRLGISPRTVEGHLNHVFDKVGATSRTELVHYALTHGLFLGSEDGSPHDRPVGPPPSVAIR